MFEEREYEDKGIRDSQQKELRGTSATLGVVNWKAVSFIIITRPANHNPLRSARVLLG